MSDGTSGRRAGQDGGGVARRVASGVDERLGAASFLARNMRKAFPDHWSFLLGEIALYAFVVLLLTGVYLTMFFKPSATEMIYHGSYVPLRGVQMSEAYASTVHLSFEVRGGLLMRQIHHWAAILFVAAICAHLLRIFFTGAFRRPREINWLIGTTMFGLAMAEGFAGYSLPDDLLSGTGLRIAQGIMLSIPVVGSYVSFFVFGGEFPGEDFLPRLFTVHVLLLPGLLLTLITVHLMVVWHQKHTQWPQKGRTESVVSGDPAYPAFVAKTGAFFLWTFATLALLATFAQINPIWLYGPYEPSQASSGSQPDWYVGFLEGALRLIPNVTTTVAGHTIVWNVFLPAVAMPMVFLTLIALYPFAERWATGDRRVHNLLDRPRNAATRTALGAAVIAWYGNLWAAGGDDVISTAFQIPLFLTVWIFRIGFFAAPAIAFVVTRRVCLTLQRRDLRTVEEGVETGRVLQAPDGGFSERHRPPSEELGALLSTRQPTEIVEPYPRHIIPLPTPGRIKRQIKVRANRFYLDYHSEAAGAGQGETGRNGEEGANGEAERPGRRETHER